MKIDVYGRCFRSEQELMDLLYEATSNIHDGIKESKLIESYNNALDAFYVDTPKASSHIDDIGAITEFHKKNQHSFNMPDRYRDIDIVDWIINQCNTNTELSRVEYELSLFQERNLIPILSYLKYLVDVMRENNIVWGVGRGSCTSSYVLYKIGIHKINSLKFNLDIKEFLKD
jgi:DNA polymerase III alpha subunit